MRFLHTESFEFHSIDTLDSIASYAILSHRWGNGNVEVLYEDMLALTISAKTEPGRTLAALVHARTNDEGDGKDFGKLKMCCEVARKDGFDFVWIDTCCIDQKSSAELSESINSMFELYSKSARCYAFLRDVPADDDTRAENSWFRKSEWFRRGWTLQELIAPRDLVFLNQTWTTIDSKTSLADIVQFVTNISHSVLSGHDSLEDICAAQKMSWAAGRRTTKVEDRAYSLLGLFGVNMTTIYGEGKRAFLRLQHEIMRQSADHSIFAWEHSYNGNEDDDVGEYDWENSDCGLLAPSPDQFMDSAGIFATSFSRFALEWSISNPISEFRITNVGIRIELPLFRTRASGYYIAAVGCKKHDSLSPPSNHRTIGILIHEQADGRYQRNRECGLVDADHLVTMEIPYSVREIFLIVNASRRTLFPTGTRSDELLHGNEVKMIVNAQTVELFCIPRLGLDSSDTFEPFRWNSPHPTRLPGPHVFTKVRPCLQMQNNMGGKWDEDTNDGKNMIITGKFIPCDNMEMVLVVPICVVTPQFRVVIPVLIWPRFTTTEITGVVAYLRNPISLKARLSRRNTRGNFVVGKKAECNNFFEETYLGTTRTSFILRSVHHSTKIDVAITPVTNMLEKMVYSVDIRVSSMSILCAIKGHAD